ncbi:MAG: prepilin-type N-terminal cleavage/methylation domain-containing protein, partial [Rubrivivax sp.]|nr:prepilin-type N-terminal cleavage/methylation domain-containing protein [Rubrivivax sp.]
MIARQQGVSLIEAVVALAVLAFGMLGLVGVQATLRGNADIAKQRAEAV